MFDRFRSRKPFRYSRWDGTQRLDDLDAESILDALSDDYMRHGDLRRALERLMRRASPAATASAAWACRT